MPDEPSGVVAVVVLTAFGLVILTGAIVLIARALSWG